MGRTENLVFCTICCNNYLPKAIVLSKSIKLQHPDALVYLCLVEKEFPLGIDLNTYFDSVYLAKDLNIDYFDWYIFKYSQLEASTFVKASFFKLLLEKFDDVIYLDPDIYVYSNFDILSELDYSIGITPHQLTPTSDLEIIDSTVIGFLMCGIYNLGFIALRKTENAFSFLDWWEHKLKYYAYMDFSRGLFTDQKWIDLGNLYFDMTVIEDFGYNVANWNCHERLISIKNDQILVNELSPLVFFHYSSIDIGKDVRIFRKLLDKEDFNTIMQLRDDYKKHLQNPEFSNLAHLTWSYNYFDSGEKVSHYSRIAFIKSKTLRKKYITPYNESNEKFLSIGY